MSGIKLAAFVISASVLAVVVGLAMQRPVRAQDDNDDIEVIRVRRDGREVQTRVPKEAPDSDGGRPARAGSLLVKFRSNAGQLERDQVHRGTGAMKVERLYLRDTQRVRVRESEMAQALANYRNNPAVEYAGPDRMVRALFTPNDPRFGEQWGMTKIDAPQAWDISTSSGSTRVAILDCGVYDSASSFVGPDGKKGHADVRDKVVGRINFTTSPNADDWCNHGTHVAGIAAAGTNNGIGVAGVGYGASVVNVKVLGDNGSGTLGWIINGILWAAGCDTNPCGARRAEIINMSLGATEACDPLVQAAIDKAWAQGLVMVAAAGNSGASGATTPANCNNVIGVAASGVNDVKASFSNFGAGVDVAAPGVSILSSNYIGSYSAFSGTSMASPHVAGLAALVWASQYNTGNNGVVSRILETANAGALAGSIYGRVDAYASVGGDGVAPSPTPTPDAGPTPTPTVVPTSTPTPAPISCTAPAIVSHSDTNPTRGGTVTFSWGAVTGAGQYRVQRQRNDGGWSTRATTGETSFSGADASNDPNWRVFVYSGTCTPIPGPAVVFDP